MNHSVFPSQQVVTETNNSEIGYHSLNSERVLRKYQEEWPCRPIEIFEISIQEDEVMQDSQKISDEIRQCLPTIL